MLQNERCMRNMNDDEGSRGVFARIVVVVFAANDDVDAAAALISLARLENLCKNFVSFTALAAAAAAAVAVAMESRI
jgi:hypothetical protein